MEHGRDLAAHRASLQRHNIKLLRRVKSLENFAISTTEEKQSLGVFTLCNDFLIRLVKRQADFIEHTGGDALVEAKHVLLFHDVVELVVEHLRFDRG